MRSNSLRELLRAGKPTFSTRMVTLSPEIVEICMAPNFGYAYTNQRVTEAQLEGMDFSSWRAAILTSRSAVPPTAWSTGRAAPGSARRWRR